MSPPSILTATAALVPAVSVGGGGGGGYSVNV